MGEEVKQEQVKEEAKAEEKKEEQVEEKKEEKPKEEKKEEKPEEEKKEEPKPPSPLVLFVDLHCMGCAKKIERIILRTKGVKGVVIDMAQNQVTIKGVVEPQAICNRISTKTKRSAKVLSPLPEAEGEPIPEVVASQVSGLATLELNVNMHCEACAEQLKKKILKMKGVSKVETELSSGKVTVTGTMDAEKLVNYVYRHTRKQAKIVPQPEPEKPAEQKPEEKKEEKPAEEAKPKEKKEETAEEKPPEEEGKKEGKAEEEKQGGEKKEEGEEMMSDQMNMQRMMHYYQPLYYIERIPPHQLFSDENPNACCIT